MARSTLTLDSPEKVYNLEVTLDYDGCVTFRSERTSSPISIDPSHVKLLCEWLIEEDLI